ncbi:MAG: Holliday junction branch migration protein RuvA [Phycisphaerae bacterium]
MICQITGRLASLGEQSLILEVGPISYELFVPAYSIPMLRVALGGEIKLHTVQYIEGNPAVGSLAPRLVGFVSQPDRDFFHELLKVKNIGVRKALRAMAVPPHQLAASIEHGDERALSALPEIGKRTAATMIAQLRGQVTRFLTADAPSAPIAADLTPAQRVAADILVSWGDRRHDAQRWIAEAVKQDPSLVEPDEIVKAAYRAKMRAPSGA